MAYRQNAFSRFLAARRAALLTQTMSRDEFGSGFESFESPSLAAQVIDDRRTGADARALAAASPSTDYGSGEFSARELTDAMPQMVWSTRADGHHDYFNRQWYHFTGVAPGSTDGSSWNGMFHPDDRERAWVAWRHSLATGEPYEIEYRLRHRTDGYRWTLGRALPIRAADGAIVRWIGTCTDINDRKSAEDQRALLTLEMSHRIKNLFAIISALVAMEARDAATPLDLAGTIQSKIAALAATHTLVNEPSAGHVGTSLSTLHAMLGSVVEPYQDAGRCRIVIRGDDCPVGSEAATALALVFHELATNAVKYGALRLPDGSVVITTQLIADHVAIHWREHGGKVILKAPHGSGFGTRLTELTLTKQLKGSIERRWERQGLLVLIEIDRRTLAPKTVKTASS